MTVSYPRCLRLPRIPRAEVDGSRPAHGEVVDEVQMAKRSPEVEGSRPENDRMSWRNPDRFCPSLWTRCSLFLWGSLSSSHWSSCVSS